jgi:hypothetical protein
MKAIILIFAILAISHASVNPWDVYEGLSTKLGLTQEQQKGFQACAIELRDAVLPYLAGGKAATQARLLSFLFADDAKHREAINALIQKVQTDLPKCSQFAGNVVSIFAKASLSADEQHLTGKQLAQSRYVKYVDRVYAALYRIYEANQNRNGTVVGENVAEIIQLFAGLSHPESLMDYARNVMTNSTTMEISVLETDRLVQQTINNAAKELGSDRQVSQEQIRNLGLSFMTMVNTLQKASVQARVASSIVEKEVIAIGAVRDFIKSALVLRENVENIIMTFFPQIKGFNYKLNDSEKKFLTMIVASGARTFIRNSYKNSPVLLRREIDFILAFQKHHPAAAGKALAEYIKALTN